MSLEIPGILKSGISPDIAKREQKTQTKQTNIKISTQENTGITSAEIKDAIDKLEKTSSIFNKRIRLYVNKKINRIVIKVIDRNTDKVIREIPPEEIQKLIARISETIGLLVDKKV